MSCPHGEFLLDGITQTNLEDDVTNSNMQTFYAWKEKLLADKAFVTPQFPNNTITPIATKVAVYILESQDLHVHGPRQRLIRLY